VASINFDLPEKRQKIIQNRLELCSKSLDDPQFHRIPPPTQPWNSDGYRDSSVFTAPEPRNLVIGNSITSLWAAARLVFWSSFCIHVRELMQSIDQHILTTDADRQENIRMSGLCGSPQGAYSSKYYCLQIS
jgi:hypothetical protein